MSTFDFELNVSTEDVSFDVENNPDGVEVDGGAFLGIDNHKDLKGRDLPNQHPTSAITGLETALNEKLSTDTKYGSSISLTINDLTYVLTAQLKDQNGDNLGTAQTIDLPLETMVVGAEYDENTKELVLTLKNGQTVRFSIADLVSGLQPTLTAGAGIDITDGTIKNTGLISATYDADNENLVLVGG